MVGVGESIFCLFLKIRRCIWRFEVDLVAALFSEDDDIFVLCVVIETEN